MLAKLTLAEVGAGIHGKQRALQAWIRASSM
jgi:hypothetical protein